MQAHHLSRAMPALVHSCERFSFCNPYLPLTTSIIYNSVTQHKPFSTARYTSSQASKILSFSSNSSTLKHTHVAFCSKNEVFEEFRVTQLDNMPENDEPGGLEELELLNKPSKPVSTGTVTELESESQKPDKDEVLEPFYKFFRPDESLEEAGDVEEGEGSEGEESGKVDVVYYEPKPGDFVVGVVVSGNENKLDVNVGADLLGTMLTKEVLPLYDRERYYLLCDVEKDAEEFMVRGRMGIVRNDEAVTAVTGPGKPVVEPGTVLFAEVLGRTLSGRPLLSTRRLFRRMAWHRVRQEIQLIYEDVTQHYGAIWIKQLNAPIMVKIAEWNTGGLLTRIEGLRAFLPKAELMNRVNNFTELKQNVGRQIYVLITRINEDTNDLILSEKDAWEMLNLQEGTLLEGTVRKIFPYGAQIRIGETNRSGLLHISKITQGRVTSVGDLLAIDEKVKVLVVKSMFPEKISLSIADLESAPGLFLSNKEKVFSEAEVMAKKYRQRMPVVSAIRKSEPLPSSGLPFEDEENLFANWGWFKFERENVPETIDSEVE